MKRSVRGKGLLNRAIDALPFELHLKDYNFCGPGTKLEKRLANSDPGINPLDTYCKEHDIAYSRHKDLSSRHIADRTLANQAWKRFKAKDTPVGEKLASWIVTTAMNAKTKLGAGKRRRRRIPKKKETVSLVKLVRHARKAVRGAGPFKRFSDASSVALKAARQLRKGKNVKRISGRILPLPKTGGVLPLLPIFAGLSALGSLAGGAAGVVKAINETKDARRKLGELQRHNQTMEAIALRQGKGLFLRPHKTGLGLYMTPYVKTAKNC